MDCFMGRRISTLRGLRQASLQRRSVYVPAYRFGDKYDLPWSKPKPAAFMMNLSGHILYHLFKAGLHLYEKPKEG